MIIVRPEQPRDVESIHLVIEAAFAAPDEARLVRALRGAGDLQVSLVAEHPERGVVGHVSFSPISAGALTDGTGLAPLAVMPAWQRRGIGSQLVRDGLAACRAAGLGFVVVLGDPAYYARFGFEPARNWGLHDQFGGGDAFQVLALRPGAIPRDAGQVRYAPAFAALPT